MRKLTDDDLERLDLFLVHQDDDDVMMLSELEGYLTGVMVCPELVMPGEWLPMVWGYGEPVFENEAQANDILGLIMAFYNDIASRLDDPETYIPLIEEDSDGSFLWEFWAAGFAKALALRPWAWTRLADRTDDDHVAMALDRLASVAAIAAERAHDPSAHAHRVLDDTLMRSAPVMFAACVLDLHHDRVANHGQRAAFSKTRRNDPCPCGSGKKYKKCCMQAGNG